MKENGTAPVLVLGDQRAVAVAHPVNPVPDVDLVVMEVDNRDPGQLPVLPRPLGEPGLGNLDASR